MQKHLSWDRAIVGGPAIELMPDFFEDLDHVEIGHDLPKVLQMINPLATRTTTGCIRKCGFCAIGTGRIDTTGFKELVDWPDLPVLCDNNLLVASYSHFDRVMDRLERHDSPDFNQGLDVRLLSAHHAERLARLRRPSLRLSLDGMHLANLWQRAFDRLVRSGCKPRWIQSYALIGFDSGPDEAWERCRWIESHGAKVYPMWFHGLSCMRWNEVTREQKALGWTELERIRIMQWFIRRREYPRPKRILQGQLTTGAL